MIKTITMMIKKEIQFLLDAGRKYILEHQFCKTPERFDTVDISLATPP